MKSLVLPFISGLFWIGCTPDSDSHCEVPTCNHPPLRFLITVDGEPVSGLEAQDTQLFVTQDSLARWPFYEDTVSPESGEVLFDNSRAIWGFNDYVTVSLRLEQDTDVPHSISIIATHGSRTREVEFQIRQTREECTGCLTFGPTVHDIDL